MNVPLVFTPDDKPYLGRETLFAFDNLICSCLELNTKCATASHRANLSYFQRAVCILAPQTISLALSIRELIRQGYLFGAKVLIRPFVERSVTMLYLFHNEEGLALWNEGWDHRERPSLQKMFENLNERLLGGVYPSVKGFTHDFNSATHGDPLSARWNVVLQDGVPVFLPLRICIRRSSRTKFAQRLYLGWHLRWHDERRFFSRKWRRCGRGCARDVAIHQNKAVWKRSDQSRSAGRNKIAHRFSGGWAGIRDLSPSGTAHTQSSKDEPRIVINPRFPQHGYKLLFEVAFLMMPLLLGNVIHHGALVGCAHAKGGVSLLPGETQPMKVQPS